MFASAKIVFATLLLAILVFSPIDACADSIKAPGTPAHPCCPAKPPSLPDDCARPGCIYMDTSVVPVAVTAMSDVGPVSAIAPSAIWMEIQPAATPERDLSLATLPPYRRFVVFHQFLI